MNFHEREKRMALREARIRRQMLSIANAERGNQSSGWITVRYLSDVMQASTMQDTAPDSDDHCADLVRDLISAGFVFERDDREYTTEAFRLDTWSVRVTPTATALLAQAIAPHPLISDPRK